MIDTTLDRSRSGIVATRVDRDVRDVMVGVSRTDTKPFGPDGEELVFVQDETLGARTRRARVRQ